MPKKTSIINILTYQLPFELAHQIFNEFQTRLKEANFLIDNYEYYRELKNTKNTMELLLSLSIFHRRVITNFNGAVKFYMNVSKKSNAETIRIGAYDLTRDECNKILAVVLNYNQLLEKFSIKPIFLEYYETGEFLRKIINLKSDLEYGESNQKNYKKGDNPTEKDIPF